MRRSVRLFVTLAIMAIFATGAYAFTADVTFNGGTDANSAGEGDGDIGGYDVSSIRYDLNTDSDPETLDSVTFILDDTASEVFARVDGTNWVSCDPTSNVNEYNCDFDSLDVSANSADTLEVAAAD